MDFLKDSFKLRKTNDRDNSSSDLALFSPFNSWLVPIAVIALLFIKNRVFFILISLLLAQTLFKKLKEEQKNRSKNMFLVEVVLSIIIYAFLVFVLYKMGGHFRETGIY